MYKKVLVVTDLSKESESIINKANLIATINNAQLQIVNVVVTVEAYFQSVYYAMDSRKIDNDAIEAATKKLDQIKQELNIPKADQKVLCGHNVVREILSFAESWDADLIVVGSHGRHGIDRLIGSTANGVVQKAHCDVLTVRYEQGKD